MEIIEKYRGKDWLINILDEYGNYKDFLHRMGIGLKQIGPVIRKPPIKYPYKKESL